MLVFDVSDDRHDGGAAPISRWICG